MKGSAWGEQDDGDGQQAAGANIDDPAPHAFRRFFLGLFHFHISFLATSTFSVKSVRLC